jgi:phosphoglycolate phosphatase-like HAD superfamily hydrolase
MLPTLDRPQGGRKTVLQADDRSLTRTYLLAMGISSYIEAGYGAAELRERITLLESERALASLTGLTHDAAYMADLQADIEAASASYVGVAVTEIASLRAQLGGMLQG